MKTKFYAVVLLMLVSSAILRAATAEIKLVTPLQGALSGPTISYCSNSTTAPTTYTFTFSYLLCTTYGNCPYPVVRVRGTLKKNGVNQFTTSWRDCDANGNLWGSTLGSIAIPAGTPDLNSYTVSVEAQVFNPLVFWWTPLPNGNTTSAAITSITTNVGTMPVSNFFYQVDWQNVATAAQNPSTTGIPDVCKALVNGSVIIASGSTGTISNYFFEVSEVDQNGNYTNGEYFGQWYSAANFTPGWWGITNHATNIHFEAGRYYRVKLAVGGPCSGWNEKSLFFHVVPDLTGSFNLYNNGVSYQSLPSGTAFPGWSGFLCSGGVPGQIKIHNTTVAPATSYRLHITEYNPNTMQIIGTTYSTLPLPGNYFNGTDRTLQSVLNQIPFTMQSVHYYKLRLEAGGNCPLDFGGEFWFVPLGSCKTDGEDIPEGIETEETGTTDVSEIDDMGNISIFPNPTNSMLNIMTAIQGSVNYTIYDLAGSKVLSGNFSTSSALDVSAFANGVYQVELSTNDGN